MSNTGQQAAGRLSDRAPRCPVEFPAPVSARRRWDYEYTSLTRGYQSRNEAWRYGLRIGPAIACFGCRSCVPSPYASIHSCSRELFHGRRDRPEYGLEIGAQAVHHRDDGESDARGNEAVLDARCS